MASVWPNRARAACDVLRVQRRILYTMKGLKGVAVLVAVMLGASACTSSHRLSAPVQKRIAEMAREKARSLGDASVKTAQVYGPASRVALVKASSGERVTETKNERKARFYLVVLHGHFVCDGCPRPPGAQSPHGTIATQVLSPTADTGDFGLTDSLPASMSRLGRPTVISLG
jgi:hypothetical protein